MSAISSIFKEQERKYPKKQILLYQAEQTSSVFRIKSGFVKVYDINSEGTEKLLLILGPGDIYPLVWTFGESDSLLYFYESMTDTEIQVISRKSLMENIDHDHQLTKELLKYFVGYTKQLMLRIECLEATNAQHKVAQVLQYLASSYGKKNSNKLVDISVPVTHQDMANMAGLSRETASIQVKDLESKKILKQERGSLQVNLEALEEFITSE